VNNNASNLTFKSGLWRAADEMRSKMDVAEYKQRIGQLIDLIGSICLAYEAGRPMNIISRVYEYFLSQFASVESKKDGQFYTPRALVCVLVEMFAPYKGHVFVPCFGSGVVFVKSSMFYPIGRLIQ